jgi:cytochrome P450
MSVTALDRDRLRELFDLRSSYNLLSGGDYADDPYPVWHELRERAPVHAGTVHELTGYPGDAMFQGLPHPDRPHFSAFSYAACDAAYRNDELFASSPQAVDPTGDDIGVQSSMLSMGGAQHRRYRSLVQPSFVPARAEWWIRRWIERTVHLLVDGFAGEGRAELNVDFCAAIPVLTITGSFGVPVEQALVIRESLARPEAMVEILAPIVAARREEPQDDLISVLVQAEVADEDGVTHRLSDAEIYSFAMLLLAAGSGTTWKQMGITLTALLQRPEVLSAVRDDRTLLRGAIEESLRWMPTDPMFSRFVTRDVDFHGVHLPQGSVLHLCLGAANRDPARWERPDEFDIRRPPKPSFAFGGGPHVCLGMHVARAEMTVGIGALLDRLRGLRLDPDAEPPRFVGMYERGATEIPVVFGAGAEAEEART